MSLTLKRFNINQAEVAAQVLDGELIIINLSNGVYYSMNDIGTDVWVLLEQGFNLTEIAQALATHYSISQDVIAADLAQLGEQLVLENLIIETEQKSFPAESPQFVTLTDAYAAPSLNIYRDMAEMLALDPPMPDLKDAPWK